MMRAYSDVYLGDVVENQGKLFDYVANTYPDKDTEDFINAYMTSKTRQSIDQAKAYVNTMDAKELWEYFKETEHYSLQQGKAMEGFMPDWIGEFYAYYQWYYNIPSAEVNQKINVDFLKKAYYGFYDFFYIVAVKPSCNEKWFADSFFWNQVIIHYFSSTSIHIFFFCKCIQ